MSKPRIFISSTYYDLKHIRSSLDVFIESLGFESILFEKGEVAYVPDQALDVSCYGEVMNADIFVLIIGGRYGSEATEEDKKPTDDSYIGYNSITKKEYETAAKNNIPIYVFIESNVNAEYYTYKKNKKKDVDYAHVDSENIYHLIDDIKLKSINNPIHTFEKFTDIESWLREQWAGLFKVLLNRSTNHKQLASLSSKVEELGEVNNTLKQYLESVMTKVNPETSEKLIVAEEKRVKEAKIKEEFSVSFWTSIAISFEITEEELLDLVLHTTSLNNFAKRFGDLSKNPYVEKNVIEAFKRGDKHKTELNLLRKTLDLPTFDSMDKE